MPRAARTASDHDMYHVMARGINQVQLFYDDEDRRAFIERLWRYRDACGILVCSWCLMANHVHLLVCSTLPTLSGFMKRLQLSYSHYYDNRYDRQGYLFQGRFRSVPIESEAQLLSVVRYIHRNPIEVGLGVSDWTSFDDIANARGSTDCELVLSLFAEDRQQAGLAFSRFVSNGEATDPVFSEANARRRIRDEDATRIIMEAAGTASCQAVCDLDAPARDAVVAMARARGLTVRQIARLTGLNRGVVLRAGVSRETSPDT